MVEQIDIGGPTMIRAAAKNAESVAVVTSPSRYPDVIAALEKGGFDLPSRLKLAAEAFAHTASYDVAVASWLANDVVSRPRASRSGSVAPWNRRGVLPLRRKPPPVGRALRAAGGCRHRQAVQHHGKEIVYNNYVDTDAARPGRPSTTPSRASRSSSTANPCGIAIGDQPGRSDCRRPPQGPRLRPGQRFRRRHRHEPSRDGRARHADRRDLHRGGVARSYEDGAIEALAKKPSIRLLECPPPPVIEHRAAADLRWPAHAGGRSHRRPR